MCDFRLVSCLEKVFPDRAPKCLTYAPEGLIGEETAFQAAWKQNDAAMFRDVVTLEVDSPIAEYIKLYRVRNVPVEYATYPCADTDYERLEPGLYPDPLTELGNEKLHIYSNHWEAVWLAICPPDSLKGGEFPITLTLKNGAGEVIGEAATVYTRIDAVLPPQKLIHTRWFHTDGLCQYYKAEMFSEEFWRITENFVRAAREMSINCLLTPTHTPPLDTRVGSERLTCQLVDVYKSAEGYTFGFEKLDRWVNMALGCGIEYFEIAHFFTQWGAEHAPKIMAYENGELKRIFGWETDAAGSEYSAFLHAYIPALKAELGRLGVLDKCLFHISDEPNIQHLENYLKARDSISDVLEGLTVIDALSNIDFYLSGAVKKPVPASDHIQPFIDAKVPGLWVYYCCGQFNKVSNSFIAMPSARTRAIGAQMFKYNIEGFLQWGFNFYNSQFSDYPINPWLTTDGDGFSPAGDCFIVYPGDDFKAVPSLRSKVFAQAVDDMRAFEKLAGYIGHEKVVALIEEGIDPITFERYPMNPEYIFCLRHRVNSLISEYAAK